MSVRLGIDASQSVASCAVSSDGEILSSSVIERPIENFTKLIQAVVDSAKIHLSDIDEIVVCIGPGSQTGVRTAVVTANALALALNKPVSGVLSTDAAAMFSQNAMGPLRTETLQNAESPQDARSPQNAGTFRVGVTAGRRRWFVERYELECGKLRRCNELALMDELPEECAPPFDSVNPAACRTCACGILLAAEHQRQLMEQSLRDEVLPFEGGK